MFSDSDGFTQATKEIQGKPAVIWEATTFRWTITNTSSTTVNTVNLYSNTTIIEPASIQNLAKNSQKIGSRSFPDLTLGMAPRGDVITLPASTSYPVNLTVETYATGGSVRIDDIWTILNLNNTSAQPAPLKLLYFDVVWKNGGKTGTSYSRLFATIGNTIAPDRTILDGYGLNPLLNNTDPVFPEEYPIRDDSDGGGQSAGVGKPTESSSPIPGATLATPTNDGGLVSSGTGEPSNLKSKKGISIGAIVGIAIACGLLGLALISGIVFFCLRRRHKLNALQDGTSRGVPYGGFAGGGGRNGGDELIAEKEANAGVVHDVTSAPHSPYSDDLVGMGDAGANRNSGSVVIPNIDSGVSPQVVLPGVDGRLEGDGDSPVSNAPSYQTMQQQQQTPHDHQSGRSSTMYSDHQSRGGEGGGSPTTLHSGGGGAPSFTRGGAGTDSNRDSLISQQQQQGRSLSTPYAHLVEEGMTEEEIRRLEEEERQLDVAIEQHAGGQRGSRHL